MNAAQRTPSLSNPTLEPEGVVELIVEGKTGDRMEAKLDLLPTTEELSRTTLESAIVGESSELSLLNRSGDNAER